jgi:ribonucleotide reductase beta subunit family protein with ferritin-like domain
VVRTVRAEEPELVDDAFEAGVREMLADAVAAETAFVQDLLRGGIPGMTVADMRTYLEHVADRRLTQLCLPGRGRRLGQLRRRFLSAYPGKSYNDPEPGSVN